MSSQTPSFLYWLSDPSYLVKVSMFECRIEKCGASFWDEHVLKDHETMKHSFQRTSMRSNISSLKGLNSETVGCPLKRSIRRRLGGMGRRLLADRETEKLLQGDTPSTIRERIQNFYPSLRSLVREMTYLERNMEQFDD